MGRIRKIGSAHCNYSQILYQFLTFTQNLKRSHTVIYNADAVGVYNILRKYHAVSGKEIDMPVTGLSSTKTIKVAV